MALIDDQYFKGPLTIGQLDTLPVAENVQVFINKYEPEFMIRLMGRAFYNLFTAGLDPGTPEPRFITLRDGADYTYNDELFRWNGFVNTELESPAANYVYCKYLYDQATQAGGIGIVGTTAENATRVRYWSKDVRAWNDMVDMIGSFYGYMVDNEATYPEFPMQKAQQYFRRHGHTFEDGCSCLPVSSCHADCDPIKEWCYKNTLDL